MATRGSGRLIAVLCGITMAAGLSVAALAGPAGASPARPSTTTYSYGPDALQTVTVYGPKLPNGASVVLIHGGGFKSSASAASKLSANAVSLANLGDTVFVVNHRDYSADVGIAAEVADVVAGAQWVIAHAAGFGANPEALTMIGGSSGGLLAADAAERLNAMSGGTVETVITLSGTMDFPSAFAYWQSQTGPIAQTHLKNLSAVFGCTFVIYKHVKTYTCPTDLGTQYSPDLQVTSTNCPTRWLIFNSLNEVQPVSQATAMDNALAAAGCPHTLTLLAGTMHSFGYWALVKNQIQAAITAD